jgi:hypothetical protein
MLSQLPAEMDVETLVATTITGDPGAWVVPSRFHLS